MTDLTKPTAPIGSMISDSAGVVARYQALPHAVPELDEIEQSADRELIQSFRQVQKKRFYWSASLTKSAIVGAGSFGAIVAVGFALANDASPPSYEPLSEVSSAPIDAAMPAPLDIPQSSAVAPPSLAINHPMGKSRSATIARLPNLQIPPLPVVRTAQAAIAQPLPKLRPPMRLPNLPAAAPQAASSRIFVIPYAAASQTARQTLPALPSADPNPILPGRVAIADSTRSAATQQSPPSAAPTSNQVPFATAPLSQPAAPGESPFQKQSELQPLAGARLEIARSIAFTAASQPELSPPQFSTNPVRSSSNSSSSDQTGSETAVITEPPPDSPVSAEEQPAAAASEADIHSFLDRSKQTQVSLVPLTDRAASEVATAIEVADFRVFHLPAADYAQVWSSVSPNAARPEYGFIDYQRQVIVVPVDRPG